MGDPFACVYFQAGGLKGKTVKIRCGPAAVIGDERCNMPLFREFGMGRRS
jgi:hypothetical protein